MRLVLGKALPAEPEVAWRFVTEPELINRWSLAQVRADDDGRTVAIRVGPLTWHVHERIEVADPPRRLVYRVDPGFPVRRHRGELTLCPRAAGTDLTWAVDFDLVAPGAAWPIGFVLGSQLRASLDRLVEVVGAA